MVPNMTSELPHPAPQVGVRHVRLSLHSLRAHPSGVRREDVRARDDGVGGLGFVGGFDGRGGGRAALLPVHRHALRDNLLRRAAVLLGETSRAGVQQGCHGGGRRERVEVYQLAGRPVLGGPEAWTTGLIVTVITVSCIIASDVGAYVFGKTFGKHQLIKISPNKTVEGAAGGLLCTMLVAFGLRQLFGCTPA